MCVCGGGGGGGGQYLLRHNTSKHASVKASSGPRCSYLGSPSSSLSSRYCTQPLKLSPIHLHGAFCSGLIIQGCASIRIQPHPQEQGMLLNVIHHGTC